MGLDGRITSKGPISELLSKNQSLAKELMMEEYILQKVGDDIDTPPPTDAVLYSPPPVLADSVRTPQIRAESVRSPHGVRTDCSDHVS
jgi:hypothetical protein